MDNEITSTNLESLDSDSDKKVRKRRKINTSVANSGRTARFTGKSKKRKRIFTKR